MAIKKIIDLRKGAAPVPASISVDTEGVIGEVPYSLWQNISQGGEEAADMVGPVAVQARSLRPRLIRVDHLFDYYNVFQGPNNFNFTQLDKVIDSIILAGAKPLLSLSYTPASMAKNGKNADEPQNWNDWYSLVKATARRYSVEKSISGIYYEVWNEPDLFGGWHYAKNPNYTTLYIQSSRAVAEGAYGTDFKIGGPATTAFYPSWIKSIFNTARSNGLRLDFISWHKYSKNMADFEADFDKLYQILPDYPQYANIEKLITEVGPNPEPDSVYDNKYSAIHLLSLVTHLQDKASRLFTFELVDGPTSRSDKSTGWGVITHPSNGAKPKPRFFALQFLNQLQGQKLYSAGDGSYVTSISTKNGPTIQTLLVNYDPRNSHVESVPLAYRHLEPGNYLMSATNFLGNTTRKNIVVTTNNYTDTIYMEPNTAQLIEIRPQ
jgi:beta-xylosidase